jgi:hypothetical protein
MDTKRLSLNASQSSMLRSTPFRVSNGRNSFFSTILSKSRPFIRFDPGCMTPTTKDGEKALAVFARQAWPGHVETFHWKMGKILIIDNWRVLHGRGNVVRPDSDRKLLRISIQ